MLVLVDTDSSSITINSRRRRLDGAAKFITNVLLNTISVSNFVGAGVGERDGAGVGDSEGMALGDTDGNDDGAGVGDRVGEHVSNLDHILPTNLDAEKNNSSS